MGKLFDLQSDFATKVALLILEADRAGIKRTFGDAYRDPRLHGEVGVKKGYGHPHSCHKVRLAVDFNVLNQSDHAFLHDYWDTIGGSKRIISDMNHYSFAYQGMI